MQEIVLCGDFAGMWFIGNPLFLRFVPAVIDCGGDPVSRKQRSEKAEKAVEKAGDIDALPA